MVHYLEINSVSKTFFHSVKCLWPKGVIFVLLLVMSLSPACSKEPCGRLNLNGKNVSVLVNKDLTLTVLKRDGGALWQSSKQNLPGITVSSKGKKSSVIKLSDAQDVSSSAYRVEKYKGNKICLSGFESLDVTMEFVFAIDTETDELLIEAAQADGNDTVVGINHFYRFEKDVNDGGYMVLPDGSGYLVNWDCPDELPGEGIKGGLVGARWTLPIFGFVRDSGDGMCVNIESWWDCDVSAEHKPGVNSAIAINWQPSLGKLAYKRRFTVRFGEKLDYLAMAKLYRRYAEKAGLLRTLKEKAKQTPVVNKYISNILFRWYQIRKDNINDSSVILDNIKKLQEMSFGVTFFFPKWTKYNLWQAFVLDEVDLPDSWGTVAEFADRVHELGCPIQVFLNSRINEPSYNAVERLKQGLDNLESKGLKFDVLYFDGYSAYDALPEEADISHPVSRRKGYEKQNACYAETRRRGIMPATEVARFWCVSEVSHFFFSDWARDRLTNTPLIGSPGPVGDPVPLFQLVFNDCYCAGFSGGGYGNTADWWPDRTPRLYELLFASAPAYNWLPEPSVPITDWDSDKAKNRWKWLKRWSSYHKAVTFSEMVSHKFTSFDRKKQRVEFANGVTAEFDMAKNLMRVNGVKGFSGEWAIVCLTHNLLKLFRAQYAITA